MRLVKSANFLALNSNTPVTRKVALDKEPSVDDGLPETLQLLPLGCSNQSLSSQAYQLLEEIAKKKEDAKHPRAPSASCEQPSTDAAQWCRASSEALQEAYESGGEQDQQFTEINARQSQVNPNDPLLVTFEMMRPKESLCSSRSRLRRGHLDVRTFRQIATYPVALIGSNATGIDCDCDECRVLEKTIQAMAKNDETEDSVLERDQTLNSNSRAFSYSGTSVRVADESQSSKHSGDPIGRSRVEDYNPLMESQQSPRSGYAIKKSVLEGERWRPSGAFQGGHDTSSLNGIQRPPPFRQGQKIEKTSKVQESSLTIQKNSKELLINQRGPLQKPFDRPKQNKRKKLSLLLQRCMTKPPDSQKVLNPPKERKFTTGRSIAKAYAWICSPPRSTSPFSAMTSHPHPLITSFDGASDAPDRSPSKFVANVNKALPPSPLELQSKSDTLSRSTTSPYPIDSCAPSSTKSPATSNVSSLSSHSTKAQFRGIARGMMTDAPPHRRSLSPVNEPRNDSESLELDQSEKVDSRLE